MSSAGGGYSCQVVGFVEPADSAARCVYMITQPPPGEAIDIISVFFERQREGRKTYP